MKRGELEIALRSLRAVLEQQRERGPVAVSEPESPGTTLYLQGRREGLGIAIGLISDALGES
ncbi:MAG: hypothetical protein RLO52_34560 [Sandaracinaceae bacterium]